MNKEMPTSVTYAVGARSDPGKRKKRNEDSLVAVSGRYNTSLMPFGLFVVADGLGGYANGQDASSGAIQAIADHVLPNMTNSHTLQPDEYSHLLAEAMQHANTAVLQQNIDLHSKEGVDIDVCLSTTVTAALVVGFTAYVAHVGNCRLYRYRPGEGLLKVTTDHLAVARLIEEGKLHPDDLYTHPQRSVFYRTLAQHPSIDIDISVCTLRYDDSLLLCSYGLWNVVRDPIIEDIFSRYIPDDPASAADVLLQTALDGGGPDNMSTIVVSILQPQSPEQRSGLHVVAIPVNLHIPPI